MESKNNEQLLSHTESIKKHPALIALEKIHDKSHNTLKKELDLLQIELEDLREIFSEL